MVVTKNVCVTEHFFDNLYRPKEDMPTFQKDTEKKNSYLQNLSIR